MSKQIHLLNKRVSLWQPDGGFQTSIDAVLLAAACPIKAGQSLLDIGCGVGAAGLCVRQRVGDIKLTGIELLSREADLARQNAAQNGASLDDVHIIEADITTWHPDKRYDHIITNPPYLTAGAHLRSPSKAKAQAMGHDGGADLNSWLMAAHKALKSKGSITIIHRADALTDILTALDRRFGATEVIPLWPKQGDRQAKRIIIRAFKDRQTPLTLSQGLTLHNENGTYTAEAEEILRSCKAL